jgi:hypothetical protein
MPRKIDPGTLTTGPGRTSVSAADSDLGSSSPGLLAHVSDDTNAHPASAIQIDKNPPTYDSGHVEGALDELFALLPPKPPGVGKFSTVVSVSGIPDWGVLKLNDSSLDEREGATAALIDMTEAWAYYYRVPEPTDDDPPFSPLGSDPKTDPTFNVADGTYTGGGEGETHAGAFTRDVGGPNPLSHTHRIAPWEGVTGDKGVVISGAIYPADRGVVALLHWPSGGNLANFLAQDLTERCLAAISLGKGLNTGCDGLVGGIFSPGDDGSGNFDPFAFPGQATGQYSIEELHTNLSDIDGSPLGITADPSAGQVRLGTDADAGEPPVVGGIPILGGSTSATGGGDDNNFLRYRLPYLADYSSATGLQFTPTAEKPRYFQKPTLALDAGTGLTQAGDYLPFPKDYWTFQLARFRHRFTMDDTIIGAGSPREDGAYIFLHFKTEHAFELLVRDGTVPSDEDLYSANLVDWTDPEAPENVGENAAEVPIAPSYHVLRAAIFEDVDGTQVPTALQTDFDHSVSGTTDKVMYVSGIRYWMGKWGSSVGQSRFLLEDVTFQASGVWQNSYRTTSLRLPADVFLADMAPGALLLPPFSLGEDSIHSSNTMTIGAPIAADTITLSGNVLLGVGVPRTPGADDFDVTGGGALVAADIASAINDPLNSFSNLFFATNEGVVVFVYALAEGTAGDGLSISTSNPAQIVLGGAATANGVDTEQTFDDVGFTFFKSRQRMLVRYDLFDEGFTVADGPLPADLATLALTGSRFLQIEGDRTDPAFTEDARLRFLIKRPLDHQTSGSMLFEMSPLDTKKVLYHSTRNIRPFYGNITSFQPPFSAGPALPSLETSDKDAFERFLDEVYRYSIGWPGVNATDQANLIGPGLPNPASSLSVPVRAGTTVDVEYSLASFLQNGDFLTDLNSLLGEAQVAGLPKRGPTFSLSAAVLSPTPSSGILIYPQTNYSTGYRPESPGDITGAQPNYSLVPGSGDREYTRAFDVAFSRSSNPLTPEGQPFFILRIRGLQRTDFAYAAPGPGNTSIAILVKVPGLTTWMDLGRIDGDGPSKQDPSSDGAGCQVIGTQTFDGSDPTTRVVFSEVRVNAGSAANLFRNSDSEVPVLVKVILKDTAGGYALDFTQGAATDDTANQRGLVGIEVVRPSS